MRMFGKIQRAVDNFVSRCNYEDQGERVRLNHYVLLVIITVPLCVVFTLVNIKIENFLVAAYLVMFLACMVFSLFALVKVKKLNIVYSTNNIFFVALLVLISLNGNPNEGKFLWCYCYPLISVYLFGNRVGLFWGAALMATLFGSSIIFDYDNAIYSLAFKFRFFITYLSVLLITSWLEFDRNRYTLKAISQQKSLEIERKGLENEIVRREKLEEQLLELANHDSLTQLWNRRFFWENSSNEIARAERYKYSIAMAILDIDFFKAINDTYGHPAGDAVLISFANLCKEELRNSDSIGRIGGEEFAIMLPYSSDTQALIIMNRIKEKISKKLVIHNGKEISVTVSIGISQMQEYGGDIDRLFLLADSALYTAKKNGRNRVELYTE